MTPHDFIKKWANGGDERRDAQPFFEDLCRLVGHQTPREADPDHTWFTYEYGATKTSGGEGWADVWKKGYFGWEAKGTHKSLDKAYQQLKMYADALQNPPLLVVSDLQTIIIHTNFTNTVKKEYKFTVDQLAEYETRQLLDAVFKNPEALKPGVTRTAITREAAQKFTMLAKALRERGHSPQPVAHFLNRLLFCMFAEDIGLLPNHLFTKMVTGSQGNSDLFEKRSRELFLAMHKGGDVAYENIDWFNGGLFEDDSTIVLDSAELKLLLDACRLDWSEIEPSIFGTLFERGLDPNTRTQLGAHYTDTATIMKIVHPVVVKPWLDAWESEKVELSRLLDKAKKSISKPARDRFNHFLERLRAFTVLDPACGSGNFLYLALHALKDIEKRVLIEGEALGLGRQLPALGPRSVKGIEINAYAAELARITIWIGEIQWMIQNGFGANRNPILQPLNQIECRDALLTDDDKEARWPDANAIIGNPPFLGGSKLLGELGNEYVEKVRSTYHKRVPAGADLVCYWFEKSNDLLRKDPDLRVGLVATNSLRGGANREVLNHIVRDAEIFDAWSDEEWFNEGAAVRVSLVCFKKKSGEAATLDGKSVLSIYPDLAGETVSNNVDLTKALKLKANRDIAYSGTKKGGNFEIPGVIARNWLSQPNPNGKPNSDLLRPWVNGTWIARGTHDLWIIDFGTEMSESEASLYEAPFEWVKEKVLPVRAVNRRAARRDSWWLHSEVCVGMRKKLTGLSRYIATPRVSKYRLFVWLHPSQLIDDGVYCFGKEDDLTFGILNSRFHEVWSLRMCTYLGVGNDPRYTPTTCYETFPYPDGLTPDLDLEECASDERSVAIANAVKALDDARNMWLYPPEWTERIGENSAGYPERIVTRSGHELDMKKRTLTNLYNASPAWLQAMHATLDQAVAKAYGLDWPMTDDEIVHHLFKLNQSRQQ